VDLTTVALEGLEEVRNRRHIVPGSRHHSAGGIAGPGMYFAVLVAGLVGRRIWSQRDVMRGYG
jgi:hypothetical protein